MPTNKGIAVKCLDCGFFMQPHKKNGISSRIILFGFIWEYWKCLKCHREVTTKREIPT